MENEYSIIAKLANSFNITYDWTAFYDIAHHCKLEEDPNIEHFSISDGDPILAFHHYIKTRRQKILNYSWKGISDTTIVDKYNLRKNYPQSWLTNDMFNGSLMNDSIFSTIEKLNKHQSNVFTGLYTDKSVVESQSPHSHQLLSYNASQVDHQSVFTTRLLICGLLALKKGGLLIIKCHPITEQFMSVYKIISLLFSSIEFYRPLSMDSDDNHVYIICHEYMSEVSLNSKEIQELMSLCKEKTLENKSSIVEYMPKNSSYNNIITQLKNKASPDITLWYYQSPVLLLTLNHIRMKDCYQQKFLMGSQDLYTGNLRPKKVYDNKKDWRQEKQERYNKHKHNQHQHNQHQHNQPKSHYDNNKYQKK